MTEGLGDGEEIPDFAWLPRYLRIPGARSVATPAYRLLADAVEEACADEGLIVGYGDPGAGKSMGVRVAVLNRCALPVTWIEPSHRPTLLALTQTMLRELGATDVPDRGQARLVPQLIEMLGHRRLIVVDECQRLTGECIDHLRYLVDHPDTHFALALTGGVRCIQVLSTEPQLARRCPLKTEFTHLHDDELDDILARYHPMYAGLAPELLRRIDVKYAHGMFGLWANMTKRLHVELQRRGQHTVTEEAIEAALVRLDAID